MPVLACGICGQCKRHVLLWVSCGAPPQFANPNGSVPAIDPMSLSNIWFLPSWGELARQQKLLAQVAESSNFRSPRRYADISDAELGQYAGVFLPGGARCARRFLCMGVVTQFAQSVLKFASFSYSPFTFRLWLTPYTISMMRVMQQP